MAQPSIRAARALCAAACIAGGILTILPAHVLADDRIELRASAGLGGIVKSSRWTPVQIVIDNKGQSVAGELIVSWGTALVRRHVDLASPSTRQFEIYIRTADIESTIDVRLAVAGRDMAGVEAPVTALRQNEPVTLCVAPAEALIPETTTCSTRLTPDRLPRSPRGYEVADRVVWPAGGSGLTPERRLALDMWQSLRRLEESGDLGLGGQVARPTVTRGLPADVMGALALFAAVYAGSLMLTALTLSMRTRRVKYAYLALAGVTLMGCGGALAIGAGVPGRTVRVHHASLLQQLPDTPGAILTVRAIAEFPAFRTFAIRWPVTDAMLEPATSSGAPEHVADAEGYPVLEGAFGLGARRAFTGEAVTDVRLLAVDTEERTTRVSNLSIYDMSECRFADGFLPADVGELRSGASVVAERVSEYAGPLFTCSFTGAVVPFEERGDVVRSSGSVVVAVYR